MLFAVGNVGNTNGVDIIPFGNFNIRQIPDIDYPSVKQSAIVVEKNTILSYVLDGVIPENQYIYCDEVVIETNEEGMETLGVPSGEYIIYISVHYDDSSTRFFGRVAGIYEWFTSVGITPPSYVVFIFGYLCYMLFIHVCFMIFDLVVFVPRKISEILEV